MLENEFIVYLRGDLWDSSKVQLVCLEQDVAGWAFLLWSSCWGLELLLDQCESTWLNPTRTLSICVYG